jgi:Fumarylacetoacetate (FAA) hydrolase family
MLMNRPGFPGGSPLRRTGFAPAGRQTEFHELIASPTPFGPACPGRTESPILLVTRDEIPDPNALKIAAILNGARMQNETTADMFDVPRLIDFLSDNTTLAQGTVILTGTPSGVGMARKPPSGSSPVTW